MPPDRLSESACECVRADSHPPIEYIPQYTIEIYLLRRRGSQ
jgi:hypothetical protein